MDLIELTKHKKIVEHIQPLLKFLEGEEKIILDKLFNKSRFIVTKAAEKTLSLDNITKTEYGRVKMGFKSTIKAYIRSLKQVERINSFKVRYKKKQNCRYLDEKLDKNPEIWEWSDEYHDHIENCNVCLSLSDRYYSTGKKITDLALILERKFDEWDLPNHLVSAKVIQSRKGKNYTNYGHLDRALNDSIKIELITLFEKSHKNLIYKLQ